uniref:oxysterol-binding protein-related protein 6-like isoform X2 n=1 Tax=Myxine glutinosa TaxID=7769 RepID=UPI00358E7498
MSSDGKSQGVTEPQSPRLERSSTSSQLDEQEACDTVELKAGMNTHGHLENHKGWLFKKRKWPLKGWHKMQRGKVHGSMDVSVAALSIKKKALCIDLDNEEGIYHLKLNSKKEFEQWCSILREQQQQKIGVIDPSPFISGEAKGVHGISDRTVTSMRRSSVLVHQASVAAMGSQSRVAAWLLDSHNMDKCAKGLAECEDDLNEFGDLLQSLNVLQKVPNTVASQEHQATFENGKKDKMMNRKWRTKVSTKDMKTPYQGVNQEQSEPHLPLCSSNILPMDMNTNSSSSNPPISMEFQDGAADGGCLHSDISAIGHRVHAGLQTAHALLSNERERCKQLVLEPELANSNTAQVLFLRKTLAQAIGQNTEMRTRLHKIHAESNVVGDLPHNVVPSLATNLGDQSVGWLPMPGELSERRQSVSEGEFYDAKEVIRSTSSSEASDGESSNSDIADSVSGETTSHCSFTTQQSVTPSSEDGEIGPFQTGRRTELPALAPEIRGVGLWEILRKNIGKDLSKVVMPVELNEPVNTLQRLCEELEYSELLDRASEWDDPAQRMVLVAAFVVSGLACTAARAGRKPFNPLLGETYECVREDHGFKFHAEQVSHHPPISTCHCESRNFCFWQDVRWKNKFWGKSMEIVPEGTVHLMLPKYGDHYSWNKVASCVHNILAGQRWIEHYGEINIINHNDKSCHCKLSFLKASYWSSNCNEVHGSVYNKDGKVLHHLFGKWNEGIHCGTQRTAKCVWRPGTLPAEHELYYGFTRFAIELNEMDPATKTLLPPTDTRFRPDQRFLEEGNLEAASESKSRLEEQQRNRRQFMEENNLEHKPRFFKKVKGSDGKESWVDNGTYWDLRKDPGFGNLEHVLLW